MENKQMNLEQISDLLARLKELPNLEREKTIFDVGARGHFENPTTDILAFFCDSNEQHGFESMLGNSLLELLEHKGNKNLKVAPSHVYASREEATENGSRIDLILHTESYILAIEVKVNHFQANPFDDYEAYINKLCEESGKEPLFAVLSPNGKIEFPNKGGKWIGISFQELVESVQCNLQKCFLDQPFGKWTILLREFLLHIKGLSMSDTMNTNQLFALENIEGISKAFQLLESSFNQINQDIYEQGYEKYGASFNCGSKSKWFPPLPTFTYYIENSSFTVALFSSAEVMSGEKNEGKRIYLQINLNNEDSQGLFQSLKAKIELKKEIDHHNKYVWVRWPLSHTDDLVAEVLAAFEMICEVENLKQ